MDADSALKKEKPLVIFYDCCMPQNGFEAVLRRAIPFADHVFVQNDKRFRKKMLRNDKLLFKRIAEVHVKEYMGKVCLFVTYDEDFRGERGRKKVKNHPAFNTLIKVLWFHKADSPVQKEILKEKIVSAAKKHLTAAKV